MRGHPLLGGYELELHRTANLMLWLITLYRLAALAWWGHGPWLYDSMFCACCILLALLNLNATLLPRGLGQPLAYPLALLVFAAVLTMGPRSYWWPMHLHLAWWIACGALALAALVLRVSMRRRWQIQLGGHGHDWIRRWAHGRPLEARALATGTLLLLNYDGELVSLVD
jgi:hypothetical protein